MNWPSRDPLAQAARAICGDRTHADYPLGPESWWKIGGAVRVLATPASLAELVALRKLARDEGVKTLVIGEMSNLLITDAPIDALCIRLGAAFSGISRHGETEISAQSGAWVPGVARRLQQWGLSGLEHICGIPGTLGGLVMMNGGSLRRSIGTHILDVTSVGADGAIIERGAAECDFAYRSSVFASNDDIIAGVRLKLAPGDPATIRREMKAILASRRLKFPRKFPNCGSVFKSDPSAYADFGPPGAMIEKAGWKGAVRGGAQVSPLHANFIINRRDARTTDVLELIGEIQQSVEDRIGHRMTPEVRVVRRDGSIEASDKAYGDFKRGEAI